MKNTPPESETPDASWTTPPDTTKAIPEIQEKIKNMSPHSLTIHLMRAEEWWTERDIKGINDIRDFVAGKIDTLWIEATRLSMRILMNSFKSDDWLVLPDEALLQALTKEIPLSKVEFEALIDSPVTMKRMEIIESLRKKYGSTQTVRDVWNHQKWSYVFPKTWESPNYKKPEVAERLLGWLPNFVQLEYILDNTNEESSLGVALQLEELDAEYEAFVKLNPNDSERIAEYSRQRKELEEYIPERVEIYIEHLIRTGWFSPDEIWVLINNGVLLSHRSLSNWIYEKIQEELRRVSSVKCYELGS